MTLPYVSTDLQTGQERQHRTQIAIATNELIKVRPPNDRTAAEVTAGVTPVNYSYAPGDVRRYGADPTGVNDSSTPITNAELAAAVNGTPVLFPEGTFRCDTGFTKKNGVDWLGAGKYKTTLKYYGSGTFITAVGTDPSRIICTIADMTLDGTNVSATSTIGVKMGWNMRANPFFRSARIYNFPNHGLHFVDQNWNVNFNDLEVDTCAHDSGNNAAGVYKDASVDAGTFNGITFNNCIIESCGSSTSTAGGVNMQTTTANRGLYFNDSIIEGNLGALQIYITKMDDLEFKNLYMEGVAATGQAAMVELDDCTGCMHGGYLTGSGATAQVGVQLKVSSEYTIDAVTFASLSTAAVDVYGSKVRVGHCPGISIRLDATGQISGMVSPMFSAHKNGTNQTAIATATFTKVTFATERFDKTGTFASSTFTPLTIGRYQVDAAVNWTAAVDQTRMIVSIYVNGTAYKSAVYQASGTGAHSTVVTALVDTNSTTDTIEIYARQDSGANKDISGATDETYFMATLIEPA